VSHPNPNQVGVLLQSFVSSPLLRMLDWRYLPPGRPGVDSITDVALVLHLDDLAAVRPNTLVVLSQEASRGEWMVSSAIRQAWERHAVALIVSQRVCSDTAMMLAERLGVAVASCSEDLTSVALQLSRQLGALQAGMESRLQVVEERIEGAESVDEVCQLVGDWLGGARVELMANPATAATPPTAGVVRVPVFSGGARADMLVAEVEADQIAEAEQLLRASAPQLRYLRVRDEMQDLRDSLPTHSLVSSVREADYRLLDADLAGFRTQEPLPASMRCCCILAASPGAAAADVVRAWGAEGIAVPLAAFQDGWVAMIGPNDVERLERFSERVATSGRDDVAVGVSRAQTGTAEARRAVLEAWTSARLARARNEEKPLSFNDVVARELPRLLPERVCLDLLGLSWPKFATDPTALVLGETVVSYFESHGSVSAAARRLGTHRNTVQARLQRARDLGLPLDGFDETLGMHLLLRAFLEHGSAARETTELTN
jgi:transposase-like protein